MIVVAPGHIWCAEQWTKLGPIRFRTRMTVVRLGDGSLWVHSPISPTALTLDTLAALGEVRFVVAPNRAHHLFLLPFLNAFPRARGFIAPGLAEKRTDLKSLEVMSAENAAIWQPELKGEFVQGLPVLNETVWFHEPTGTLITTDLLFSVGDDNPASSRLAARMLGVYGRLAMSRTMKLLVKDKHALSSTARNLLALPIGRVIVAHDSIVETHAKAKLVDAFQWLQRYPPAARRAPAMPPR